MALPLRISKLPRKNSRPLAKTRSPSGGGDGEGEDWEDMVWRGRFAVREFEKLVGTRQFVKFARLGQVAMNQFQVLGFLQFLITAGGLETVGNNVARQGGQHIFGRG